jgi:hypothetical protein
MRDDITAPPIAPAITKHIDGTARLPLPMLGRPPKCGYLQFVASTGIQLSEP